MNIQNYFKIINKIFDQVFIFINKLNIFLIEIYLFHRIKRVRGKVSIIYIFIISILNLTYLHQVKSITTKIKGLF